MRGGGAGGIPILAILVFSVVAAGGMAGAQDASELDRIRREIKPIKADQERERRCDAGADRPA
jgi:Ni/Co efflux regulator RcnB